MQADSGDRDTKDTRTGLAAWRTGGRSGRDAEKRIAKEGTGMKTNGLDRDKRTGMAEGETDTIEQTLSLECMTPPCLFRSGNSLDFSQSESWTQLGHHATASHPSKSIAFVLYQRILMRVLSSGNESSDALFSLLSTSPSSVADSRLNLFFDNLLFINHADPVAQVLHSIVHPDSIASIAASKASAALSDQLAHLTIRVLFLSHISHSNNGLATILAFTQQTAFVSSRGLLFKPTLCAHLPNIVSHVVRNCVRNNHLPVYVRLEALKLAHACLDLANKIKNTVYDVNIAGVLVASSKRRLSPTCAGSEAVQKKGPIYSLSQAVVRAYVCAKLGIKAGEHRTSPQIAQSASDSQLFVALSRLSELSFSILKDLMSMVTFDSPSLDPYLHHAKIVERRPLDTEAAVTVTEEKVFVLPRFSQKLSQTLDVILNAGEQDCGNYSEYIEALANLMPPRPFNSENEWIICQYWTQELEIVKPKVISLFRILGAGGSSADRTLSAVTNSFLESILCLTQGSQFCRELVEAIVDEALRCIDGRDLFMGRADVLRGRLEIICSLFDGCGDFGASVATRILSAMRASLNQNSPGLDAVRQYFRFARSVIRFCLQGSTPTDANLIREISGIFDDTLKDSQLFSLDFDLDLAFLLPCITSSGAYRPTPSVLTWLRDALSSATINLFKQSESHADVEERMRMVAKLVLVVFGAGAVQELRNDLQTVRVQLENSDFMDGLGLANEGARLRDMVELLKNLRGDTVICGSQVYAAVTPVFDMHDKSGKDSQAFKQPQAPPSPPSETFIRETIAMLQMPAIQSNSRTHASGVSDTKDPPVVVFKQYEKNSFRAMSAAIPIPSNSYSQDVGLIFQGATPGMHASAATAMSRTLSNTSRAPSVHVDTFLSHGPDAYQQQSVNMHAAAAAAAAQAQAQAQAVAQSSAAASALHRQQFLQQQQQQQQQQQAQFSMLQQQHHLHQQRTMMSRSVAGNTVETARLPSPYQQVSPLMNTFQGYSPVLGRNMVGSVHPSVQQYDYQNTIAMQGFQAADRSFSQSSQPLHPTGYTNDGMMVGLHAAIPMQVQQQPQLYRMQYDARFYSGEEQ
ncbi:hypothetical protein BJ741DRAFT_27004 [Chytriomyces cf. hyalinus JEL632]|nr:hypothetical protein BJ741DRAFT_27004 [Chytriomyces cf. hyalinus JEL632]